MNIQDMYELEVLVIGNILNDRKHLSEIAVLPEYFFDNSCRAIINYVSEHKVYNLYDMCLDLDINFELATEDCVIKLRGYAELRTRVYDEIVAAQHAMAGGIDPISAGSILKNNLDKMID